MSITPIATIAEVPCDIVVPKSYKEGNMLLTHGDRVLLVSHLDSLENKKYFLTGIGNWYFCDFSKGLVMNLINANQILFNQETASPLNISIPAVFVTNVNIQLLPINFNDITAEKCREYIEELQKGLQAEKTLQNLSQEMTSLDLASSQDDLIFPMDD